MRILLWDHLREPREHTCYLGFVSLDCIHVAELGLKVPSRIIPLDVFSFPSPVPLQAIEKDTEPVLSELEGGQGFWEGFS